MLIVRTSLLVCQREIFAFDEVERKPNFDLCAEKIHIPVRTPKWPPRWSFAGACHSQ